MNNKNNRVTMRRLTSISRCLSYIREVQFKEFGMTRGQHSFCSRIYENPGINQDELSYLLKMDKTTTSKAIKKLIEKNFVKRVRSKSNHRAWELYTTEKFSRIRDEINEVVYYSINNTFKGVTQEEINQLDRILEKMQDNIFLEWENIKKE